jgi:propionyl-CoA synthetase
LITDCIARSEKIFRGATGNVAGGDQWAMPATIEDSKVLDEIGGTLKGRV